MLKLIHSSVDEHFSCIWFFSITNEAAVNILCKSLCEHTLLFLMSKKIHRNRTAVSYDSHLFNFLERCKSVFQSAWNSLHPQQSVWRVWFFSTSLSTLGAASFLNFSHSSGMCWYNIVVLVCVSLVANYEYLFVCLVVICVSPLVNSLFRYKEWILAYSYMLFCLCSSPK